MILRFDMPDVIPVFPLPGALLLPRAKLPLHVFEPRYLSMIEDCMKTSSRFIGMVQTYQSRGETKLHSIGCAGRLNQFSETEDGRYMVTLSGMSRFRIKEEVEGFAPYRRCHITWDGFERDLGKVEKDKTFDRPAFMAGLKRYFEHQELSTDWETMQGADDELLINSLSMLCPFEPGDKQALLEAPSLSTRRETLTTLIEFAMRGGAGEDFLQ
ncbi:MAG: LON peptidase substrate-binding domain-containing protein [Planktomarina sp.]|nr:LON peptidase substrate-binding domain-containing protein [Planktomarina sp.]